MDTKVCVPWMGSTIESVTLRHLSVPLFPQSGIVQEGLRKGEQKGDPLSAPLLKPIPVYGPYIPTEKEMESRTRSTITVATPSSGAYILPQFSHRAEDNLLYMSILPVALDAFKPAENEILTFGQIWRYVVFINPETRPAKFLFHHIINMDNHHFCRWSPDPKTSTSVESAFAMRNITPTFFSTLNQKVIPTNYNMMTHINKVGQKCVFQDDLRQMDFLKTHLIKIDKGGNATFVPFGIKWQELERKKKANREFCDWMESKVAAAVVETLITSNSTYMNIIIKVRKRFPELLIVELYRIFEKLDKNKTVMIKVGYDRQEGTIFKVGTCATPAVIQRVQERLKAEAPPASINIAHTTTHQVYLAASLEMERGSVEGTNISQLLMDTHGNQPAASIIASLHNLTENQLPIESNQPTGKKEWMDWSIVDSGVAENQGTSHQSSITSEQPETSGSASNNSPIAQNSHVSITRSEAPISSNGVALLEDSADIFEKNNADNQLKVNYTDSSPASGNRSHRPIPILQEGISQSLWAPNPEDGQAQKESPSQILEAKKSNDGYVFKVPQGRAPRRKRRISQAQNNAEPATSKQEGASIG